MEARQPMPTRHPESVPVFPEVRRLVASERAWSPDARNELLAIIESRRERGIESYEIELCTHNGRIMAKDALEEAGDLLVYAVALRLQGSATPEDVSRARAALKLLHLAAVELLKVAGEVTP